MKNNGTSLSQAFKLYTGTNVVKFTLKWIIYSFLLSGYMASVFSNADEPELKPLMLFFNSFFGFMASSVILFSTYNSKKDEAFFRTVKDSIGMYQKYHLISTFSGVIIIVLTHLCFALFYSSVIETVNFCLVTLLIRALANILCLIKRDIIRILILLIPSMISLMIFAVLIEDKIIKLELGTIHILLAVSATVIFVVSEIIVLKHFRKNWYKD